MARAHQITAQILASANEVTQRLKRGLRDADRSQLPGGEQPRELERVTSYAAARDRSAGGYLRGPAGSRLVRGGE